ncbi:MAG: hypothetical protein JXR55_11240 [Candidatus Fermentibacteraceae bacterium]|nr:hypothetical protein [Candidatus Fermentibacteraceae bacterium]
MSSITMQLILPLCALLAACGGAALPDHTVSSDRVDSMDVSIDGRILTVRVYSAFGIGSYLVEFTGPVEADSLVLELLYGEGRPFRICESLKIETGGGYSERDCLLEAQPVELLSGTLRLSLPEHIYELYASWIDFFRS